MTTCKHCKSDKTKLIYAYQFYDIYVCTDCDLLTEKDIENCCRDPFGVHVFKYGDHAPQAIYTQCRNCGGCLNMTKPLPFKSYSDKTSGEFSRDSFNSWKKLRATDTRLVFEINSHIKYSKTNDFLHKTHLQSQYWKTVRRQRLEMDKWICQSCRKAVATDVHHLHYETLGNESLDELISYCRACHTAVHDKSS